jgi:hypothetical protein
VAIDNGRRTTPSLPLVALRDVSLAPYRSISIRMATNIEGK